ncbi:hypothetical protein BKA80DRAFT_55181 [Phyllosticta citrichinensis]
MAASFSLPKPSKILHDQLTTSSAITDVLITTSRDLGIGPALVFLELGAFMQRGEHKHDVDARGGLQRRHHSHVRREKVVVLARGDRRFRFSRCDARSCCLVCLFRARCGVCSPRWLPSWVDKGKVFALVADCGGRKVVDVARREVEVRQRERS